MRADKSFSNQMFKGPYNLAAVLALVLGAAIGARGASNTGPTVKGNVSIQLPAGWHAVNAGGRTIVAAQAPQPDKDASGQFQASLSISQDAGNKIDGAAQQAVVGQVPGYQPIERPTPITIGGLQGVTFGGTFKSGNTNLRTRQYMFTKNNQIYTITFTSLTSTWGTYQAIIQGSVGTFAVK